MLERLLSGYTLSTQTVRREKERRERRGRRRKEGKKRGRERYQII